MSDKQNVSMSLHEDVVEKIDNIQEYKGFSGRTETVEEIVKGIEDLDFRNAIDDNTGKKVRSDGGRARSAATSAKQTISQQDVLTTVGGVSLLLSIQQWTLNNRLATAVYAVGSAALLSAVLYRSMAEGDHGE